jgi:hypothetical protein
LGVRLFPPNSQSDIKNAKSFDCITRLIETLFDDEHLRRQLAQKREWYFRGALNVMLAILDRTPNFVPSLKIVWVTLGDDTWIALDRISVCLGITELSVEPGPGGEEDLPLDLDRVARTFPRLEHLLIATYHKTVYNSRRPLAQLKSLELFVDTHRSCQSSPRRNFPSL